ncbi:hypothetical protein ACHAW5_004470 [Stephanodiscus triporus]|uniref:Uncharacterized protein n=1 Tax=Stephanodiscus triporus TaxID=2934178 RepID=A0ABD3QD93_9STRA
MNRLSFASLLHVLALSCGLVVAVSASHNERQLRREPIEKGWEKEQELAELLNNKIEESKSTSPTLSPITLNPTLSPTAIPSHSSQPSETPTTKPSTNPSAAPSASANPTSSTKPSPNPSVAPTLSAIPTSSPTHMPSMTPSTSMLPSKSPTLNPTSSPTTTPSYSSRPSVNPTAKPSMSQSPTVAESTPPSPLPTHSSQPSDSPTGRNVRESSLVIDQDKSMNGSATALVIISVFGSILMASASAYLYRRGVRSQERKMNTPRLVSLTSNEIEAYLDLQHGNAESSDTVEYLYSGGESKGEWVDIDMESGKNGIIDLPYSDSKTSTAADDDEVISAPTMETCQLAENGVIEAVEGSNYYSVTDNESKDWMGKSLKLHHLPPKIPNFKKTRRHKTTELDDNLSIISEIASDQLSELIEDVNLIKSMLSQLNGKEERDVQVEDNSCSANECLQWFAGVSDNASTGSLERERNEEEEQEAHVATLMDFVKQKEADMIRRTEERQRQCMSVKKDRNERSLVRKKSRQRKR